jgi:hypothetical protein
VVAQSANHFAQQSASNDGRGPQRGCAARPACANARWRRGAIPGGPDHASPGHALDDAQVSSHARVLAQRRWGGPSAGAAGTGTSGNGAAGNAQPHAHGTTGASAAAPPNPAAGGAGWLPWLALGGSLAALIAAEAVRRHVQASAEGHATPVGGIPLTAFVLYIVAALLAVLALCLFVRRA